MPATPLTLSGAWLSPNAVLQACRPRVFFFLSARGLTLHFPPPLRSPLSLQVVESDKADMDVESFADGILGSIVVPEGGVAGVGSSIAFIAETEADLEAAKAKGSGGELELGVGRTDQGWEGHWEKLGCLLCPSVDATMTGAGCAWGGRRGTEPEAWQPCRSLGRAFVE